MSENLKLKCSKCSKTLKVPSKYAGRVVACPGCKQKLRVPEPVMAATLVEDDDFDELEELPPASKPRRRKKAGTKPAESAKAAGAGMSVGDWIASVILFPIGPILVILYGMRKDPKWLPVLGVTVAMFGLVGGVGYIYMDDIVEYAAWNGQEDRLNNDNIVIGGQRGTDAADEAAALEEFRRQLEQRAEQNTEAQAQAEAMMKPPTEEVLSGLDEISERAYRANVGIRTGDFGSGSGVICKIDGDKALILTNRHVIDPQYQSGAPKVMLATLPPLEIHYINDQKLVGKVIWVAEGRVDLALVEAKCPTDKTIRDANWQDSPRIRLNDSVFTIGNPIGLGWTSTKGAISGVRNGKVGDRDVPMVQIDASINRGNSGGGLYNSEGQLIGINSSMINQQLSRNLGFAIRVDYLRELKPPGLEF